MKVQSLEKSLKAGLEDAKKIMPTQDTMLKSAAGVAALWTAAATACATTGGSNCGTEGNLAYQILTSPLQVAAIAGTTYALYKKGFFGHQHQPSKSTNKTDASAQVTPPKSES